MNFQKAMLRIVTLSPPRKLCYKQIFKNLNTYHLPRMSTHNCSRFLQITSKINYLEQNYDYIYNNIGHKSKILHSLIQKTKLLEIRTFYKSLSNKIPSN